MPRPGCRRCVASAGANDMSAVRPPSRLSGMAARMAYVEHDGRPWMRWREPPSDGEPVASPARGSRAWVRRGFDSLGGTVPVPTGLKRAGDERCDRPAN
jgi:hypothetical protein